MDTKDGKITFRVNGVSGKARYLFNRICEYAEETGTSRGEALDKILYNAATEHFSESTINMFSELYEKTKPKV